MHVSAELFVIFILVELVPPFMAAAGRARALVHGGVIKLVAHLAVVFVVAGKSDAFACGQEGQCSKPCAIGLNGQRIQVGHQPPFGGELLQCDVDALAARVGRSTVGHHGARGQGGALALFALQFKCALFKFAYTIQMILHTRLGGGAQW